MNKKLLISIFLLTLSAPCQSFLYTSSSQQQHMQMQIARQVQMQILRALKINSFTAQFRFMEDVFTVQDDNIDTLYADDGESIKAELMRGNTLTLSVTRNFKNMLAQQQDEVKKLEFRVFCTTIFKSLHHLDFLEELKLDGLDLSEITDDDIQFLTENLVNLRFFSVTNAQSDLF